MKNPIIGLILAALILITPGCTTTDTGKQQIDPVAAEKLAPILSGSVAGAVVYAYTRNANTEAIVDAVKVGLNEFLLTTNMSPAALQAKLNGLPVPALKTPEAQLIIAPLLATYAGFADSSVKDKVKQDEGLRILIQAMVTGLDQGLEGIRAMKQAALTPIVPETETASISDTEALQTVFRALEVRMRMEIARL